MLTAWLSNPVPSSENAAAAVDMLNATQYGAQLSKVQLFSNEVDADMNMAYQAALATIGSEDSAIPTSAFFNAAINMGGYRYKYFSVSTRPSHHSQKREEKKR